MSEGEFNHPQSDRNAPDSEDALLTATPVSLSADMVPSFLLPSILATTCCFFPIGIVALTYAIRVPGKLAEGDLAGAEAASRAARRWVIIAMVTFILLATGLMVAQLLASL
jgi:hypothetical protein